MPKQLQCRICKTLHKATTQNFPLVLYGNIEVYEGKGRARKRITPDRRGIIGYACKQCVQKGRREEFIKEHGIKLSPGEKISDAITRLVTANIITPKPYKYD